RQCLSDSRGQASTHPNAVTAARECEPPTAVELTKSKGNKNDDNGQHAGDDCGFPERADDERNDSDHDGHNKLPAEHDAADEAPDRHLHDAAADAGIEIDVLVGEVAHTLVENNRDPRGLVPVMRGRLLVCLVTLR